MKAWFIALLIVGLTSLNDLAYAEDQIPKSPEPYDSIVPKYLSDGPSRLDPPAKFNDQDQALPTPLTAAPPPDPELPTWGRYLTPSTSPVLSPVEYSLVGPPTGVVQHAEDDLLAEVASLLNN